LREVIPIASGRRANQQIFQARTLVVRSQNSCSMRHSTVKCSNAVLSRDRRGRRFTRRLYAIADPAALLTRQATYSKRTPTCQMLACLSRLIENPAANTGTDLTIWTLRINRPSALKYFGPIASTSVQLQSKTDHFHAGFSQFSRVRPFESSVSGLTHG